MQQWNCTADSDIALATMLHANNNDVNWNACRELSFPLTSGWHMSCVAFVQVCCVCVCVCRHTFSVEEKRPLGKIRSKHFILMISLTLIVRLLRILFSAFRNSNFCCSKVNVVVCFQFSFFLFFAVKCHQNIDIWCL